MLPIAVRQSSVCIHSACWPYFSLFQIADEIIICICFGSDIEFIRTGESAATIEVHLANDGGDSYERERYGDRIIVIRHITSSGTSTYKIQNADRRTISTSRTDLLKMALFMNIQVDNPVCVMTQDATRSFLRE